MIQEMWSGTLDFNQVNFRGRDIVHLYRCPVELYTPLLPLKELNVTSATLQVEANAPLNASTYQPLSSVWEGTDGKLLDAMLEFYPSINPHPILDATYNTGRIWHGSAHADDVVSMDIDPQYEPMILADNRAMEGVPDSKFGVVVYDPPHVGPQGRDKSVKRFDVDFGATMECGKQHGWTLSYLYPPFLNQARRVLKADGLLLAKITDMVNSHRSRWAHVDFMRMAEEAGFTVCDLIVKVRTGPMRSTKWKVAHHARKRHCFWIICRNGSSCERS